MSMHNIQDKVARSKGLMAPSGRRWRTSAGWMMGWGTTVGNSITTEWAPGARFHDTDGTSGSFQWVNKGDASTANWVQENSVVDDEAITFGTGSDVSISWNGSYLQAGETGTLWANAPSMMNGNYTGLCYEYFNDFTQVTAGPAEWTVTEDHGDCAQAIVADTVCGQLLLTNKAATDNNAQQIVFDQEVFKMATGKKLWFETKVKAAAGATQIDWIAGLIVAEDLTAVADNMPANGIVFHKDDSDTNIDISSSDNATNLQTAAVGTATTGWVTLGFYFDGAATGSATITPYVDGTAGTAIGSITYATVAEMAPYFAVRNGDGTTTQTLAIDYVRVLQLR